MRFFKIFFQISIYFISLWLMFCNFRSYERSELQVHQNSRIFEELYKKFKQLKRFPGLLDSMVNKLT